MLTIQQHSFVAIHLHVRILFALAQCTQKQPVEYCLSVCRCVDDKCKLYIIHYEFNILHVIILPNRIRWSFVLSATWLCSLYDSKGGAAYNIIRLEVFRYFLSSVASSSVPQMAPVRLSLSVYFWNFVRYESNDRTVDSTESFDNLVLCQFGCREMCHALYSYTIVTPKQTIHSNLNKSNLAVAANIRTLFRTIVVENMEYSCLFLCDGLHFPNCTKYCPSKSEQRMVSLHTTLFPSGVQKTTAGKKIGISAECSGEVFEFVVKGALALPDR